MQVAKALLVRFIRASPIVLQMKPANTLAQSPGPLRGGRGRRFLPCPLRRFGSGDVRHGGSLTC